MAAMCAGTALPLLSTYPALLRLHASQLFTCCDGCCACASANASSRHKGGLYALLNALKAAVPPGAPPPPVQLCDRGDGSPLSKAESLRRWAHLSPHHVPDLVRLSAPPALYEFKCQFKCWTWANRDVRYGGGGIVNAYASGKPSTAEGHVFAFGGTEELLRRDKTWASPSAATPAPCTAPPRAPATWRRTDPATTPPPSPMASPCTCASPRPRARSTTCSRACPACSAAGTRPSGAA